MIVISVILNTIGIALIVNAWLAKKNYEKLIESNDKTVKEILKRSEEYFFLWCKETHLNGVLKRNLQEKEEEIIKKNKEIMKIFSDNEKMRYVLEQQRNVKGENEKWIKMNCY